MSNVPSLIILDCYSSCLIHSIINLDHKQAVKDENLKLIIFKVAAARSVNYVIELGRITGSCPLIICICLGIVFH
jgi:hypothetical protein